MKLSKNQNSNSRINQTCKCSSVSIDGKTNPIVHNTYEWFTPRKSKQNRVKSNSKITNPITLSNRFNILLEPIDDPVQSQTTPVIANQSSGTIIHMSREPDSTTTLVVNISGSLDGTVHTDDTDNTGASHIHKCSSANYLHHLNIFTLCVGNVQSAENKINTIADYTHEHDLDRHLIVESWLPEDEHRKKGELKNNSYEIKHIPRDDRHGGGVMCLYKSEFKVEKIKPPFPIKAMEFMDVMLTVWSKKVCLVTIYRPEAFQKKQIHIGRFCIRMSLS